MVCYPENTGLIFKGLLKGLRCFIAIELPDSVKSSLVKLQDELKNCGADVRWVNTDNMHLTLKFLGNIKEEIVKKIIDAMKKVCGNYNAFSLEIKGIGTFPGPKSPRVLWLGVENSSILKTLQADIEEEMSGLGFTKEKRGFRSHLTLGRFRSSAGKEKLFSAVKLREKDSFGTMQVNSTLLMQSDLNPGGARHTKISDVPLKS